MAIPIKMSPLLIDLPQMIDLALGTPECGVVNFNVLQALLHIIVRHLPFDDCRVEFRGEPGQKLEGLIPYIQKEPMISVTEYHIVNGDTNNRTKKEMQKIGQINTIIEIKKPLDNVSVDSVVNHYCPSGFPLQPITIETNIPDMYEEPLSDSEDIIQAIAPSSNSNPVNDMWNMLNITKRIDALEIAIQKLSSVVNDVGKDFSKLNQIVEKSQKQDDVLKDQLDELDRKIYEKSKSLISVEKSESDVESDVENDVENDMENYIENNVDTVEVSTNVTYESLDKFESESTKIRPEKIATPSVTKSKPKKDCDVCSEIEYLKTDVKNLKIGLEKIASLVNASDTTNSLRDDDKPCPGNPNIIKQQYTGLSDQEDKRILQILQRKAEKNEQTINDCYSRTTDLESGFTDISQRLDSLLSNDKNNDNNANVGQTLSNLCETVEKLSNGLHQLMEQYAQLETEANAHVNSLEDIKKLLNDLEQSTMADQAEINEILQEKADITQLHRYVQIEKFEAANRQFSNKLSTAQKKINEIDSEFQQTIHAFHLDLETKAPLEMLKNLQQYSEEKLKKLQERITILAELNHEPEAAGTRMKFLRDVSCISCQTNSVMRTEENCVLAQNDMFVPKNSMRPVLTYQMDNYRKQMYNSSLGRNMNNFSTMTKNMNGNGNNSDNKMAMIGARYCGGSHTAVGSEESYRRRNLPKLKEIPRIISADNYATGSDGSMYKCKFHCHHIECNCKTICECLKPITEKPLDKKDE